MQPHEEMSEALGTPCSDITILGTISQGERFCVLKGRKGSKFVTLKVARTPDGMHTELLRREYEIAHTLSHVNIVTTLDFVELPELGAAILMEYIEGERLEDFLKTKTSHKQQEAILDDILAGLDYLHHRGILHNDLKPANIIITRRGTARIIDFGLSASDDGAWSGCFGGSDDYSAPEVLEGRGAKGATSDIFSIGRIIDKMFRGRRYGHIVRRCTNPTPHRRYDSVEVLRRAIVRHRRRPIFAVVASLLVAASIAIATPHIHTFHKNKLHSHYRALASEVLEGYYTTALESVEKNRYSEFAIVAKGIYSLQYMEYRESLPAERHLATDELFAEHTARFDSLTSSLPTVNDLPDPQRDSLLTILDNLIKHLK